MKCQRPHPVVVAEESLKQGTSGVPQTHGFVAATGCYKFRGGGWGRGFFEAGDGREVRVGGGWGEDAAFDYVLVAEEGGFVFGG